MELTLSVDAPAATAGAPEARAPEPGDPTAVAFAALLGALMAGSVPVPTEVPEEAATAPATAVEGDVVAALTGERAAYPALALVASAPLGAAEAPAIDVPDELLDVVDPEVDATEAELPDLPAAAKPAAHPSAGSTPEAPTRPVATVVPDAIPLPAATAAAVEAAAPAPAAPEPAVAPVSASSTTPLRGTTEILKPEVVAAPAPPTPVEQVVRVVTPLRRLGDGQHDLVLELRPADLGTVRVELSLDKGIVHLGLRAEVEQTGQLLRAALPELRQQLDAAGVQAGRVAVDAEAAGQGRQWRTSPDDGLPQRRRPDLPGDDADEVVPTAYSSTAAYGHVDVLL